MMNIVRKVRQTKFQIDGRKGLLTLHDGGQIAASGNHKYVFDGINYEEIGGYFSIRKPTLNDRKIIFDTLFNNQSCSSKKEPIIKVYREDNCLKFERGGIDGFLMIDDSKRISGTENYRDIFEGLNYDETNGLLCINQPKTKECKEVMDRLFNSEKGVDLSKKSGGYLPTCNDLENTYRQICKPNEEISEDKLFDLYEQNTDKELVPDWRNELIGKCFK